jgi:prepilin-type processing-associated H-X9-DG protein
VGQPPHATDDPEAADMCRNALLSHPVSYIYMAYATQNMQEVADSMYMHIQATAGAWYGNEAYQQNWRAEEGFEAFEDANRLMDVGCPDWSKASESGRRGVWHPTWSDDIHLGLRNRNGAQISSNRAGYTAPSLGNPPLPENYIRLKEGVERFFITDINNPASGSTGQSTLAAMWDAWGGSAEMRLGGGANDSLEAVVQTNHLPGGSNVLFMDGHVEFVRYGSEYPVTAETSVGEEPNALVMRMVSLAGGQG